MSGALVGNELQNHDVQERRIEARFQEQQRRELEQLEQRAELD
jgi:hypothetical protein